MSPDLPHDLQQAHALLDRLPPAKLGAVRRLLLEVMVDDDRDDELTEDDRAAINAGAVSLDTHGGSPMEAVLADFGLTHATLTAEPCDDRIHRNRQGPYSPQGLPLALQKGVDALIWICGDAKGPESCPTLIQIRFTEQHKCRFRNRYPLRKQSRSWSGAPTTLAGTVNQFVSLRVPTRDE